MAYGTELTPIGQGMGDQNALQILMAAMGGSDQKGKKQKQSSVPSSESSTSSSAATSTPSDSFSTIRRVLEVGTAHQISQLMAQGVTAQEIAPRAMEQAKAIDSLVSAAQPPMSMAPAGKPPMSMAPGASAVPNTPTPAPMGAPAVNTPNPTPEQAQGAPYYKEVAASGPFGFGGAKIDKDGNLVEQKAGIGASILMALLGVPNDARARADINKLAAVQKVTGEEPIQPEVRYKTKVDAKIRQQEIESEMAKLDSEAALKDEVHARSIVDKIAEPIILTGEAIDKKPNIEEVSDNAVKLLEKLRRDPSSLRTLGLPGDPEGQEILLLANTIKTRSKFMTGGKALTQIENKLIDQISTSTGIRAFLQDPETQIKILEGIQKKAEGYLREIDPYIDERKFVNAARGKGYSDGQIFAMLKKRRGGKTNATAK